MEVSKLTIIFSSHLLYAGIDELGPVNLTSSRRYHGDRWSSYLHVRNETGYTLDIEVTAVFKYGDDKLLVPRPLSENTNTWTLSHIKKEKKLLGTNKTLTDTICFLIKFSRMQGM